MRYLDSDFTPMPDSFDQSLYDIVEQDVAKEGAYDTIDNETKFALDEEDYEKAMVCYPKDNPIAREVAETEARMQAEKDTAENVDGTLAALYETVEQQAETIRQQDEVLAALYEALGGSDD
jgi:hypothetical protein